MYIYIYTFILKYSHLCLGNGRFDVDGLIVADIPGLKSFNEASDTSPTCAACACAVAPWAFHHLHA